MKELHPVDADNPGNPPQNSKNQLDDLAFRLVVWSLRSTEEMNFRFTIILGYLAFFLWIWMGIEVNEMETKETMLRYVPMWGFALTAWIIVRLEFMNKKMKSTDREDAHPSTANRPNEA